MSNTITDHPPGEPQHSVPEIVGNNVRDLLGSDLINAGKESGRNDETHHATYN